MDKCKHGNSICSECGIQSNVPSDIVKRRELYKETIAFNKICAEVLELREIWESKTELYVARNGLKFLRTRFNPYNNVNDMTSVIDYIMEVSPDEKLDTLVADIKNNSVLFGFREFIKSYHTKNKNKRKHENKT